MSPRSQHLRLAMIFLGAFFVLSFIVGPWYLGAVFGIAGVHRLVVGLGISDDDSAE